MLFYFILFFNTKRQQNIIWQSKSKSYKYFWIFFLEINLKFSIKSLNYKLMIIKITWTHGGRIINDIFIFNQYNY